MPTIIFIIILASIYPAKADDVPFGVVPLWKIDVEKIQVYRNLCWNQKTGEKERECCIGFDVECADSREMWIHFPHGINRCENIYTFGNEQKKEYFLTYCSGNPDPVTKEVQIEECPLSWSDNSEAKFLYSYPLNPIPNLYEEDRDFYYRGSGLIIDEYSIADYRIINYAPFMLGWGKQDEFLKYNRFSRKDVKDMICVYGPFDTKESN